MFFFLHCSVCAPPKKKIGEWKGEKKIFFFCGYAIWTHNKKKTQHIFLQQSIFRIFCVEKYSSTKEKYGVL